MQVVVSKDFKHFMTFRQRATFLRDRKWRQEAHRGVIDAGRKTKTQVQRAVAKQMAVAPGAYQGYVVGNTSGIPRRKDLSFSISARQKGAKIQTYKGLRALSEKGRTAKRYNKGRSNFERGFVRSGVWNEPRTFKRSFARNGGFFALRPSSRTSATLPKEFWTYGNKPNQPRDAQGRFKSTGRQGYSVRKLYGPALGKELDRDLSLKTFQRVAPVELEIQVKKRIARIVRF